MLSILGSLLGFASSSVPAVTDLFAKKGDRKHELEKMKLAAELKAQGMDVDMKQYEVMGADKEHERLIAHDTAIMQSTGWTSALQKSVRPIITYAFFGLFSVIEVTLLMSALENGTDFREAIQLLWDEDTKAIFAAIISFWFGSRAVEKARQNYRK
tara:strand:- start:4804 stop:5271 length:468 start_codon:yes stop_codon:yes gene_type:complete